MNAITEFQGAHRFLSNFWPSEIEWRSDKWLTVEHAYQASKSSSQSEREYIRLAGTPALAKRYARLIVYHAREFHDTKIGVMTELVRLKFQIPTLAEKLKATGDARLIEGNRWGDVFWSECPIGEGSNNLGKILMLVREEIRR